MGLPARPTGTLGFYAWEPVKNHDGHVDIDPDRYDYRIKEDPLDVLDRVVKESLKAAWAAPSMPSLTLIINKTRADLRALFEEHTR